MRRHAVMQPEATEGRSDQKNHATSKNGHCIANRAVRGKRGGHRARTSRKRARWHPAVASKSRPVREHAHRRIRAVP